MLQDELQQLRLLASHPESGALERLASLLDSHVQDTKQQPWLAVDILRCYQHIWLNLPSTSRDGQDAATNALIRRVQQRMKDGYTSFAHLLRDDSRPALMDPLSNTQISHAGLRRFVLDFDLRLPCQGQGKKPRVAVMLPNGPILALACLAIANRYTIVPMARTLAADQLRPEIEAVHADAVLMLETDAQKVQLDDLPVFGIQPQPDLTFTVTAVSTSLAASESPATNNGPDDVAILLFTSGTSGKKKLVPITTYNLFASTVFTMDSVALDESSRGLNMMPLHHIGGMVRSLYAPMLAGSCTICCASFDANLFWDVVESHAPTWYYATPTMHQMILSESEHRPDAVQKSQIRFICNAGGGIPATLAVQLREVFKCVVLPSYGMTECAPITAPEKDYELGRAGTSGRPVGPDVAILNGAGVAVAAGTTGRICVRGFPVFSGYLRPEGLDTSVFDASGWFDTGDLGHLDSEGYLFITGRSKEVINRGGEIISPLEVEDAILSAARDPENILFGRVSETLAFSAPHDVLQEVVGAVIVTPPGKSRPDLRQLHEAVQDRLHQPKWPAILVYMDAAPKSNNKLQRIRLGQRLGLDTLTDSVPMAEKHFEARCPPVGTPLTVSVPMTKCLIDGDQVQEDIARLTGTDVVMRHNPIDRFPQAILFNPSNTPITLPALIHHLRPSVHGYLLPSSIKSLPIDLPQDPNGDVDEKAIDEALSSLTSATETNAPAYRVRSLFAAALNQSTDDITPETDFFLAGGDSLSAGKLISTLRREFSIKLAGDVLFLHPTVAAITSIIEKSLAAKANADGEDEVPLPGCTETRSSTNPLVLLANLIPMLIFYPLRVGLQWTIFVYVMAETARRFPLDDTLVGRLIHIVLVGLAARIAIGCVAPIAGICFKWVIMCGRHKPGLYPMWGSYHMRWWLAQKAVRVAGVGVFNYFNATRVLYYRALGARIGRNVSIHQAASLGEHDLITLEDNVVLENCIVRPFAVERNTSMLLAPIVIGSNSSVGLRTVVAPGSNIGQDTHLGPNSSSWEASSADSANKELNSSSIPTPHWIWNAVLVEPMVLLAGFMFRVPWLAGLVPIVLHFPLAGNDMLRVIVYWFTDPGRIGWHIIARVLYAVVGPLTWFATVLILKAVLDITCGKSKTGPISKISGRQRVRQAALFRLLPGGSLGPLTRLIGKHYELVSVMLRLLGVKAGKRIYWPSVGPGIQDFDLVTVGNDVVFGSRSYLVTSDGSGRERVVISDGAMLGDRAVVLPGVTIGEMAMVGSGSLLRRNGFFPPDTVWTGSRGGNAIQFPSAASSQEKEKDKKERVAVNVDEVDSGIGTPGEKEVEIDRHDGSESDAGRGRDTTKPFGRAFYQGLANFHVINIPGIVFYSTLMVVISTVWRLLGVLAGLLVLAHTLRQDYRAFDGEWWRPFSVYALFCAVVSAVSLTQTILGAAVVILTKWAVMGRRTEGAYHWDRSSYNQRWQFFLTIETLIKDSYRGIGVLPMISGTAYLNLYYRLMGANIGKDCALLANGDPNILLTEPDMVTLGDRVAVDDASLVCHLNTRGEFELHPLVVGERSVLRTGSRLMSGSSMGRDACLLEHTLVLSGDCVDDGQCMQGWPAELFEGARL
ncbi:uncharacterized protein BJX67DRAFT_378781 [Aspergillus lucknowensis]|uniref:Carrier domain-containing protein n=1 Tax=Aspergillus lucknowensis TaxID=176173 RepID=A0ABR4LZ39_9EURO